MQATDLPEAMLFGKELRFIDREQWVRLANAKGWSVEWTIRWIVQGYPEPPRWLF